MCGWSFIIGILSAFDTLAPQACDSDGAIVPRP
jgi:hypothetical protein